MMCRALSCQIHTASWLYTHFSMSLFIWLRPHLWTLWLLCTINWLTLNLSSTHNEHLSDFIDQLLRDCCENIDISIYFFYAVLFYMLYMYLCLPFIMLLKQSHEKNCQHACLLFCWDNSMVFFFHKLSISKLLQSFMMSKILQLINSDKVN